MSDLNNLSFAELKSQQEQIQKAISEKLSSAQDVFKTKVRRVLADLAEEARELDLDPSTLGLAGKVKGAGTKAKLPPKYRDENGNEWSGRGRRPEWINDHLAKGGSVEDFLIK